MSIPVYLYTPKTLNKPAEGMFEAVLYFFSNLTLTYELKRFRLNKNIEELIMNKNNYDEDIISKNLVDKLYSEKKLEIHILILNKHLSKSIGVTHTCTLDNYTKNPVRGAIVASTSRLYTKTGGFITMYHELLHLLPIEHCKNPYCIMYENLAYTLADIIKENTGLLCPEHTLVLQSHLHEGQRLNESMNQHFRRLRSLDNLF